MLNTADNVLYPTAFSPPRSSFICTPTKIANEIILAGSRQLDAALVGYLPTLIAEAGDRAQRRFIEYFTAEIRNPNTRRAYARSVRAFCDWCTDRDIRLEAIRPTIVAAYIEDL